MSQLTKKQRKEKIALLDAALQQAEDLYHELMNDSDPLDDDEGCEGIWITLQEHMPTE